MTGPTLVFALCLITSATCAGLLIRAYIRTRARLLLWSAVAFVFLSINNMLVFFDLAIVGPSIDLLPLRYAAALAAVCVLIYGFIWEAE
ncbi:DUF5985 family protein [Terricaulis sp.]|uniref:DUF5985 family protein n=1 Tax=Terricaulis sp. TaxID=2768686 RepID=UPI003783872E